MAGGVYDPHLFLLYCVIVISLCDADNYMMSAEYRFPPKLRTMCHCLDQVIDDRFPGDSIPTTGTVIFLRFYNPALGNLECVSALPFSLSCFGMQ